MQDDGADDLFCTSEALFVFTRTFPDVLPGDRVLVSGMVDEYAPGNFDNGNLTITQLIDPEIRVISRGNQLPVAIAIGTGGFDIPGRVIDDDGFSEFDPFNDGIDFYESLESMLVRVESGVVVGPRNQYNEVVVIPEDRIVENVASSAGALILQEVDPNPERIMLNLNTENREKIHVGARLVNSVTGILDYSYGNYKVNVFGIARFTVIEHEVSQASDRDKSLRVATYNVENLSRFDESRIKQLAVDVNNLLNNPDILVLHEILDDSGVEDDGVVSAEFTLTRLVELMKHKSGVSYNFVDNPPKNNRDGGVDGGNIRSVILFREDTIKITEDRESGLSENPTRIGPDDWPFSVTRKPLVVIFDYKNSKIMVMALHLTSRGADTPLFGRDQPINRPEEEKRVNQAAFIQDYLRKFHMRNPDVQIIVAGDLNDDPWSKTLAELKGEILVDLGESLSENEKFTYILDGNAIQLDYILVSIDSNWKSTLEIIHRNSIYDHTLQLTDHDPVVAEFLIP